MNKPSNFKRSIELVQIAKTCIRHSRKELANDLNVNQMRINAYLLELEATLGNIEINLQILKEKEE